MTDERLYYHDSYLTDFRASVTVRSEDGTRICLDKTTFYPASGGQPHDTGMLSGVPVVDVVEEGDRIVHVMASPVLAADVEGRVDWERRFDHMQQHSGQHLLSAVLVELFGIATLSFHMGEEISTIELGASSLDSDRIVAAEKRANEIVTENRPVTVSFEHSAEVKDLRKASDREGLLRVVTIESLDRSACGGTHVRATGEIGPVLIRKLARVRGNVRIEFLCGMRAVRRARADFDGLSSIAHVFSSPLDEAAGLAATQYESLRASEKARRKLAAELAQYQGRDLYAATAADEAGFRRLTRRLPSGSIDEELRALSQGFTAQPKAVFLAVIEDSGAVLMSVSKDAGIHAGNVLKAAVTKLEGRGGGSELVAQGSVPPARIEELPRLLKSVMPSQSGS